MENPHGMGERQKWEKQLPSPDPHFHFLRVRKPSGAPAALLHRGCPAPGLRWKQGKLDLGGGYRVRGPGSS